MKLLLLEDDHETAESVRRGLAEAGHTVDVAATADEGLHLALGVQSRGEVGWIASEAVWLVSPSLADGFEGREAV